jgi:hypothetical protein
VRIASAGLPDTLARRHDEDAESHVQRLLAHDLCVGATDSEIADIANTSIPLVRYVRAQTMRSVSVFRLLSDARVVRRQIGFGGSVFELLSAALRVFATASQRRTEALSMAMATSSHPGATRAVSAPSRAGNQALGGVPATSSQARGATGGSVVAAKAAG